MSQAEGTYDRIAHARHELTPRQIATGLALVGAIGFVMMFLQEPLAHDAMHNFRHAAGIACH